MKSQKPFKLFQPNSHFSYFGHFSQITISAIFAIFAISTILAIEAKKQFLTILVILTILTKKQLWPLMSQVSIEIITQVKIRKKSTNKTKGNFEYLWVGKVSRAKKKVGVPLASWEIQAQKGPKLALLAKSIIQGLKRQTRPLFHFF